MAQPHISKPKKSTTKSTTKQMGQAAQKLSAKAPASASQKPSAKASGEAVSKQDRKSSQESVSRPSRKTPSKPTKKHGGKPIAAKSVSKSLRKPAGKPETKPASKPEAKSANRSRPKSAAPAAPKPGKDYAALLRAGLQFCPHARECGACQTINGSYDESLQTKDDQVAELFEGLVTDEALEPTLGMDVPLHYRNKVISPFVYGKKRQAGVAGASGGSDGFVSKKQAKSHRGSGTKGSKAAAQREILCGMYAQGTHRVVDTRYCLVENEQAKAVIQAIRALMAKWSIEPYDEDTGEGFLRHAVVRVGHKSGEVLVTLVTNDEAFPSSKSFCRELVKRCPFITTIVQNVNKRQTNVVLGEQERTLYGPGFILDELCGLSFRISSQSFYQVNATQTEVMYNVAMDFADVAHASTVIDAYCGTGTIGLVAAKRGAGQIVGVDNVASAIEDARQNARHNGLDNATFVHADATEFMKAQAAEGASVDVLLMDPPRAGSTPEFLHGALQLNPQRIVYISCNPQTQARDAAILCKGGFCLTRLQPVDMFPHTDHVETVALFERATPSQPDPSTGAKEASVRGQE